MEVARQTLLGTLGGRTMDPYTSAHLVELLSRTTGRANARGILNRDLSVNNVLLGHDRHFKISDFGLAKLTDLMDSPTRLYHPMGNPSFCAPELAVSGRNASPATEVFSLGVVLHRLVTGRLPFLRERQTVEDMGDEDLVRIADPQERFPRNLRGVVRKCLEWQPEDRYPDAVVLADELRRYLDGRPLLAQPLVTRVWGRLVGCVL
jgi:serine/threonine-protein kinase